MTDVQREGSSGDELRGLNRKLHAVHGILSVLTVGAWLPVWGLHWLYRRFGGKAVGVTLSALLLATVGLGYVSHQWYESLPEEEKARLEAERVARRAELEAHEAKRAAEREAHEAKRAADRAARKVERENIDRARSLVWSEIGPNDFNISKSDLKGVRNPDGDGVFVYVPRTRFFGVKRLFIWLVLGDRAAKLNGAAAKLTPQLPWPREFSRTAWTPAGIDPMDVTQRGLVLAFGPDR